MGFNPQVNVAAVQEDGLTPHSLEWSQWPVSSPQIVLPGPELPRVVGLVLQCAIPPDTPQANRYDADGNALPDPVGMTLAWVSLRLVEEIGTVLHKTDADHTNGKVEGFVAQESDLWKVLTPGVTVKARITAEPWFFYLEADGGARLDYSNNPDGYFHGIAASSALCELSMDQDGKITIRHG